MKPTGAIKPPAWMTDPSTLTVIAALSAGGAVVRLVGGCVRDAIVGRAVSDIDLATPETPESVMARLEAAGLHAIPTGLDHGTVTTVVAGQKFEITTLRKDVETFGRKARVAFTKDWEVDARRRDFTINAMYADPDGTLYDPTGGRQDLEAGRVQFIDDAADRIQEDYLRILRFFRFHAWFGKGRPDPETVEVCRAHAAQLKTLSAERVSSELLRLLAAPDPAGAVAALVDSGTLAPVLAEAVNAPRLAHLARIEKAYGLVDPIRRLAALLRADDAVVGRIGRGLRLSNRDSGRLTAMAGGGVALMPKLSDSIVRQIHYRLGPALFGDILFLSWADSGAAPEDRAWREFHQSTLSWETPVLPVGGGHLLDLGVAPGPRVGALLARVEDWWLAGGFKASRQECIGYLSDIIM